MKEGFDVIRGGYLVYGDWLGEFDFLIKVKKIITLDMLNDRIKSFKYFESDKTDIPNEISDINIQNGKFTQTAGQMKTLYHNLPLIIGDLFLVLR